jgi:hypothetical protein
MGGGTGWIGMMDAESPGRSESIPCLFLLPPILPFLPILPILPYLNDFEYYGIVANVTDTELTRALERCEIPNEGFPHRSHLRVAWIYLRESATVDEAIDRMASTLRRFAASVGKAEKYSHPTTVFWMHQVAAVRALMPEADCDAALRAYPRLLDKNLILPHDSSHAATSGPTHPPRDASNRPVSG